MNMADFWRLIDESRQASQGNCDRQAVILQHVLEQLPLEEIISYYDIYREFNSLAYRKELRVAAHIINGSGSDDGFTDFRAWLISHGEFIFYQALKNIESLADISLLPDENAECEQFAYAPLYAYENKAGTQMPKRPQLANQLVGDDWSDEDLPGRYPRLWAKYVSEDAESSASEDEE